METGENILHNGLLLKHLVKFSRLSKSPHYCGRMCWRRAGSPSCSWSAAALARSSRSRGCASTTTRTSPSAGGRSTLWWVLIELKTEASRSLKFHNHSRRFELGEGLSWDLLSDCETNFKLSEVKPSLWRFVPVPSLGWRNVLSILFIFSLTWRATRT